VGGRSADARKGCPHNCRARLISSVFQNGDEEAGSPRYSGLNKMYKLSRESVRRRMRRGASMPGSLTVFPRFPICAPLLLVLVLVASEEGVTKPRGHVRAPVGLSEVCGAPLDRETDPRCRAECDSHVFSPRRETIFSFVLG
jgi:hypothetical protein